MKYRIKEQNGRFEIECEVRRKPLFRKEKIEWMDVDVDGDPFYYIRLGSLPGRKIDNWSTRLKPFDSLEEAQTQKEIFEKGVIYHN